MLPPQLLDNLFPFHLSISEDLNVNSAGSSVKKLEPQVLSPEFSNEIFEVRAPAAIRTHEELKEKAGHRVEIFLGEDKPILVGQLAWCDVGNMVYFLGSPVIENPELLEKWNLSIDDFAPHDASLGMMFLQHFQSLQLEEVNKISSSLQESQQQTDKLKQTEQRLLDDLHAACDVYIRFKSDGTVTEARSAKPKYIPISTERFVGRNIFNYLDVVENAVRHYDHLSCDGGMVRYDDAVVFKNETIHFSVRIARTQYDDYLLVGRDISERERQKEMLDYQANHDELTMLANRRQLNERLTCAINRLQEDGQRFAVLTIDLDDFKQINDIYGHSAGDFALKVVAKRLDSCMRSGDVAARLGGDEFCLLLENVKAEYSISSLADRVLSALGSQIGSPFGNINIAATVGMVIPEAGDSIDEVFRSADLALYEAKSKGKNRSAWFSPELRSRHQRKMILVEDMRRAIEKREFQMEYQPIVDLRTKRVHALEALARWEHAEMGRIPPDVFIELAEEFNLISDLSSVLFEICCRDLAWFRQSNIAGGDFQMNFNVSARELREAGFAEKMINAVNFHDVPAESFTLELTESALIENVDRAKQELGLLKQQGISIALDDFGKGYSSLSYLARLPVDVVKVDKIFVQGLLETDDNSSVELINAIVSLQDSMGIKVVAEGIETGQQLHMLKSIKCAFGQGYYLGLPASRDRTASLFSEGLDLKTLRVVS